MKLAIVLKLSKIGGWINFFPDEYLDEIEDIHDRWIEIVRKAVKERHTEVGRVRKEIREWVESPEMAVFSRECRERYLKKQLVEAKKQFQFNRNLYIEGRRDGKSDKELASILKNGENLSKKINGYKISIGVLTGKIDKKEMITDEMIERAREFSIINLVEVGANGRIKCPFHQGEHHNASIKNNFFYCFVCSKHANSLGVYMELHKCGFKEAVLALQ